MMNKFALKPMKEIVVAQMDCIMGRKLKKRKRVLYAAVGIGNEVDEDLAGGLALASEIEGHASIVLLGDEEMREGKEREKLDAVLTVLEGLENGEDTIAQTRLKWLRTKIAVNYVY
jgi:hypothetical protein